jgi:hypothetical protein
MSNENSSQTSVNTNQIVKKKIVVKKRETKKENCKKKIEQELDNKYPSINLQTDYELTYDLNIPPQFLNGIKKTQDKINFELIKKLPCLKINAVVEDTTIDEPDEIQVNQQDPIDEVDTENLELNKVGDKYYYFDYDKGIIYNLKYKPIGCIDEYGEISIETGC